MYSVIGLNHGEVRTIATATNLKNLDVALRGIESQFEGMLDSYNINESLPTYKELLAIFKDRKNKSKIVKKAVVLESNCGDSDYVIQIEYNVDNVVFSL